MAKNGILDFESCSKILIFFFFSNIVFLLRVFEKIELGNGGAFSKHFFCGFLENGTQTFFKNRTRTFFKNLKFPKSHLPAIQKMLILS